MKHRLGKTYRGPFSELVKTYENSFRYYLMVRNQTILLLERAIPFISYIVRLIYYFIPVFFIEGPKKALNSLIMGLTHGLFKKEGYLDPTFFKISPR